MNPVRPSSSLGAKPKKKLKSNRGLQQGHSSTNSANSNKSDNFANEKDVKSSSTKEFQEFAGVSSESIRIYAEPILAQTSCEKLSEEACNVLTEDINFKLRHIIRDCLIKSKLQGRDAISSDDVNETFSNLNIEKVYGASSSPNWLTSRDRPNLTTYKLDDQTVNLIEIAEKEFELSQEGDIVLSQVWLPDGNDSEDDMEKYNETFAEYFKTMCEAVLSDSEELRRPALLDISTNPSIGPITDWFYHFSFLLLTKSLANDRLIMRVLQLLEVLENSPLSSLYIYSKQLKLLVQLLLQRLLVTSAREDVVKYMCYVLSVFSLRGSLKCMVLNKLEDRMYAVCENKAVPLLNIIYYMGIDAVNRLFVPNMFYFLKKVVEENDPNMVEIVLAIYGLLCKANLNRELIYDKFKETFGAKLLPYYRPKYISADDDEKEVDIVKMRKNLIKTRRKVDYRNRNSRTNAQKLALEEIFEITPDSYFAEITRRLEQPVKMEVEGGIRFRISSSRLKLGAHQQVHERVKSRRETQITVGKTSLLLSVLKRENSKKCTDHSLYSCWL